MVKTLYLRLFSWYLTKINDVFSKNFSAFQTDGRGF
jgi:hypothetical protein